ncbi:sugar nucleotide-binding protein, partial [Allofournierella massiliensis]|uniref:sugar nucleotide-binding protein n=1 Tax=Allofournierella massiliensis TaxID=1650663 RepID=UPI0024B0CEA6
MANSVLVGSTGFVGGNLMASHPFNAAYHSSNVQQGFGRENDLVVYAGVPAAMFLANQDPEADLAVMRAARENLRRLAPKKLVLISSICVYADSRGKTEADEPQPEGLAAYGANRLQLERWVREDWPDALIVRLPALYGLGLKKNFLYDLHTITPALLRPAKYEELAAKSELVKNAYSDAGNNFYKLNGSQDSAALKQWFAANDFNALAFTDSRSV